MKKQAVSIKMFLKVFLLFMFLAGFNYVHAQGLDTTRVIVESGWIEKMSRKLAIDISLNNSFSTFKVMTPANNVILYPNSPNQIRVKLNYDFLSLGYRFAPDFIPGNGDNDIKGKTKSYDLAAGLIFNHWFADLSYSKVKGFYLKNTDDYILGWEKGDPYTQFPDLQYSGFAIKSGYIQNSKFSYRSLTSQTERQLKSAGSFIPVFNFSYYKIDDKSQASSTQKSNNMEANIGPGYAYTFVADEKFYLSLGANASIGYLHTKLTTRQSAENIITKQNNFIFRWEAKTGVGYNGRRFYTGLYADVSGTEYKQEDTTAKNFETRVFYHLFMGIRINSPDVLKNRVNEMKSRF